MSVQSERLALRDGLLGGHAADGGAVLEDLNERAGRQGCCPDVLDDHGLGEGTSGSDGACGAARRKVQRGALDDCIGQGAVADEQPGGAAAEVRSLGDDADGAVALLRAVGGSGDDGCPLGLPGWNGDGGREDDVGGIALEADGQRLAVLRRVAGDGQRGSGLVAFEDGAAAEAEGEGLAIVVGDSDGEFHGGLLVADGRAVAVGDIDRSADIDRAVAVDDGVVADTQGEVDGGRAGGHGQGRLGIIDVILAVVGELDGNLVVGDPRAGDGAKDGGRACPLADGCRRERQGDGGRVVVLQGEDRGALHVAVGSAGDGDVHVVGGRLVLEDIDIDEGRGLAVGDDDALRELEALALLDGQIDVDVAGVVVVGHGGGDLHHVALVVLALVGLEGEGNEVVILDEHAVGDGVVAVVLVLIDDDGHARVYVDILVIEGIDVEIQLGDVLVEAHGAAAVGVDLQTIGVTVGVAGGDGKGLCDAEISRASQFAGVAAVGVFLGNGVLVGRQFQELTDIKTVGAAHSGVVVLVQCYLSAVGSGQQLHDGLAGSADAGVFVQVEREGALHGGSDLEGSFVGGGSYVDAALVLVLEEQLLGPSGACCQVALVGDVPGEVQLVARTGQGLRHLHLGWQYIGSWNDLDGNLAVGGGGEDVVALAVGQNRHAMIRDVVVVRVLVEGHVEHLAVGQRLGHVHLQGEQGAAAAAEGCVRFRVDNHAVALVAASVVGACDAGGMVRGSLGIQLHQSRLVAVLVGVSLELIGRGDHELGSDDVALVLQLDGHRSRLSRWKCHFTDAEHVGLCRGTSDIHSQRKQ